MLKLQMEIFSLLSELNCNVDAFALLQSFVKLVEVIGIDGFD
jgi:hypothetical protein